MSDLISRQEAIEAVATVTMSIHLSNVLCDKLLALPSADIEEDVARRIATIIENEQDMRVILKNAEPKTGKWVRCKKQNKADLDNGNALYECSNCGHTDLHAETQEVPYCWYCGARMGSEDGEE